MKNLRTFFAAALVLASFSAISAQAADDGYKLPVEQRRMTPVYEAVGNLYAQAKSKVNGMMEVKDAPRPRAETTQLPLPEACPVNHWRKLEGFGAWLRNISRRDEAAVLTAIQSARSTCGINAKEFNASLNVIETIAFDKYFNDKGADGVIPAVDKLRVKYGEVSSTAASK